MCYEKSVEISNLHKTHKDKKIEALNEKIVKACMDYDIVNELKQKK